MSKFLAFLTAIAKPLLDLLNNIFDPSKQRARKRFELEEKIKETDNLRRYLEKVIRTTKNAEKKNRMEVRLAYVLDTLCRMRHDLQALN